jgi:transcriptional regulator with XRE-family HTH domain
LRYRKQTEIEVLFNQNRKNIKWDDRNVMINKTIGSKIKSLRIQKELKQHELAAYLSVTSSTISNWENDRRSPSIDELSRIADFFKVSLNTFAISTQFDLVQNEQKQHDNTIHQNIQLHDNTYKILKNQYIFTYVLVIIVFASHFFSGVIQYFLYFFGLFSLIGTSFNILIIYLKKQSKGKKTLSVPNTFQVYFEHNEENLQFKKRYLVLKVYVISSLILTPLFIFLMGLFIFNQFSFMIVLSSVVISLLLLLLSFYRLQQVFSSRLYTKYIDYYENLQFDHSFFINATPYLEGFILVLIALIAAIDQSLIHSPSLYLFIHIGIVINIGLSLLLHQGYFAIKTSYNLYIRDTEGVKQLIS